MSFADVKKEVQSLSRTQRRELQKMLALMEQQDDPKWIAEMERRKTDMKAGKKISREAAMRLLGITDEEIAAART